MPEDEDMSSNCTDDTKREAYLSALKAAVEMDNAKATYDSKKGSYRAVLKRYGKLGVDTEVLANEIKNRFDDPDERVIFMRETLKMAEISGKVPRIMERLYPQFFVQEPTQAEEEEGTVLAAYDTGAMAGRKGRSRDENPHVPGTLAHAKWAQGWLAGQRAIAEEMWESEIASPVQNIEGAAGNEIEATPAHCRH